MPTGIDLEIFSFFNRASGDPVMDGIMATITDLGSGYFLFVLAMAMMIFRRKKVRGGGIILMAGLSATYYVSSLIKHLVARPRPFLVIPDVNTVFTVGGFSFPSAHSTMAFMAAFILTKCFGRGVIFYGLALVVAVSRMYLGVHYPSDVLAGGILGTLIGYSLVHIAERVMKSEEPEEVINAGDDNDRM